jgi:hypothetical protein
MRRVAHAPCGDACRSGLRRLGCSDLLLLRGVVGGRQDVDPHQRADRDHQGQAQRDRFMVLSWLQRQARFASSMKCTVGSGPASRDRIATSRRQALMNCIGGG